MGGTTDLHNSRHSAGVVRCTVSCFNNYKSISNKIQIMKKKHIYAVYRRTKIINCYDQTQWSLLTMPSNRILFRGAESKPITEAWCNRSQLQSSAQRQKRKQLLNLHTSALWEENPHRQTPTDLHKSTTGRGLKQRYDWAAAPSRKEKLKEQFSGRDSTCGGL